MPVNGPAGGCYQLYYIPVNTVQQSQSANRQPLPNVQSLQLQPTTLKKVPVGEFAKLGACVSIGVGILCSLLRPSSTKEIMRMIKSHPVVGSFALLFGFSGVAAGGAAKGALLAWLFNKTQKKAT